jgi:hypothetical protein
MSDYVGDAKPTDENKPKSILSAAIKGRIYSSREN